jgi:hypothetical protein
VSRGWIVAFAADSQWPPPPSFTGTLALRDLKRTPLSGQVALSRVSSLTGLYIQSAIA